MLLFVVIYHDQEINVTREIKLMRQIEHRNVVKIVDLIKDATWYQKDKNVCENQDKHYLQRVNVSMWDKLVT